MAAESAHSKSGGTSFRLGLGGCCVGAVTAFVWLPESIWGRILPSLPSKLFPPLLATAFAAGWIAGIWRLKTGQDEEEGAIRSQASVVGLLTGLVASFAAYAASGLPLSVAVPFGGLALLPSALFANIGASFAQSAGNRRNGFVTLAVSASLPVAAVSVWPVVYGVGKLTEKPPVVIAPAPAPVVVPEPPKPRYEKPGGFDDSHAWKRYVASQDVIRNADHKSVRVLSRDERHLAFVTHDGEGYQLAVRHLYDPGPDYAIQTQGGISALAWSPDDRRVVFLAANTGLFWVCEPTVGKMIPLPIPKIAADTVAGLAWWKGEDVAVTLRSGETQMLSLATLRLKPASENEAWAKMTEVERTTALRMQTLHPGGKVGYEIRFDGPKTAVAAQDSETAYEQALVADLARSGDAFTNRDGSILFLSEETRLRVLYMGLRAAPTLRFIGEATDDFPTGDAVTAALAKRAVRAVIAAPIVNPLNGKTVAGDSANIKGYARFIAASGKTCSVWIENELQPVREGDVLISLSTIQDGREFSVSRDWWAVLTKADDSQSIPRRADVPVSLPSPTRELLPLPELVAEPKRSATVPPPQAPTPAQKPVAKEAPTPIAPANNKPSPQPQAAIPAQPPETDEERLRKFIVEHNASFSRGDIESTVNGYGAIIDIGPGRSTTRDEFAAILKRNRAGTESFTEVAAEPIEVKRLTGNRFSVSYVSRIEIRSATKPPQSAETLCDLEVLLTGQGPKIVKQRETVLRSKTTGRGR